MPGARCHRAVLPWSLPVTTDREWNLFSKPNTATTTRPSIFPLCSTCGARLVFRMRKTRLQSALHPGDSPECRVGLGRVGGRSLAPLRSRFSISTLRDGYATSKYVPLTKCSVLSYTMYTPTRGVWDSRASKDPGE